MLFSGEGISSSSVINLPGSGSPSFKVSWDESIRHLKRVHPLFVTSTSAIAATSVLEKHSVALLSSIRSEKSSLVDESPLSNG